jgi:uncharacterized protein
MSQTVQGFCGSVVALWRYPVKSMMGEELNAAELIRDGIWGDRAYALLDTANGKVASAKNPRKWPTLFDFRAALANVSGTAATMPPVRITLPDGTFVRSEQPDVDEILSAVLKRSVSLSLAEQVHGAGAQSSVPEMPAAAAEEYWPDIEGLEHRDTVTDFGLPQGRFFDAAPIHVLTTATLDRLRALYPQGRFEVRRFRPNIIIETAKGEMDFVESAWIGHTLAIGDEVRLSITGPCPRCVMTTLAQGDLPRDVGILRTAAQHNQANVGVYASVLHGGTIRRADSASVE